MTLGVHFWIFHRPYIDLRQELRDSDPATTPRPQATGKTHPYMSGQPLPAGAFPELGASNDLNLTLRDMTLNDLILKEFGFQLKGKMEVFSKVVACAEAT